ncbi:hypothetical protein [Terrarubrum flagellatum]|uniref:hypothetical protein n=1 Tax=Terrirubrum flagellatum TaxID=2895980 RepID=UPI003145656B
MKLSRDAIEALILLGGFGIVALAGLIVFLVWPTNIYGDWRVFLTLFVGALIAIPTMLALKKKWASPPK